MGYEWEYLEARPVHVPGYVDLPRSAEALDAIAAAYLRLHRPDGVLLACAVCETPSECAQRAWARRWTKQHRRVVRRAIRESRAAFWMAVAGRFRDHSAAARTHRRVDPVLTALAWMSMARSN